MLEKSKNRIHLSIEPIQLAEGSLLQILYDWRPSAADGDIGKWDPAGANVRIEWSQGSSAMLQRATIASASPSCSLFFVATHSYFQFSNSQRPMGRGDVC